MEKVRLSKIAQISAGQAAPKEFSDFGLPFIRAGHLEELIDGKKLNELPKVNDDIAKKNKLKVIPAGSILFAKSGMSATKNRIFITTENSYYVSHLAAVIPSPKYDSSYLARFLSWYNPTNLILDNAYPSIRLEDINNLEITLPNLANQQRIAAILDQADAIIQNNRAIVQKYDALTQSLFLDMFGDPVMNEKGWEVKNLGKILKFLTSGSRGWAKYYSNAGDIFLRIQNIGYNKLRLDDLTFINTPNTAEAKRTKVEPGDIVISITADLGRTAVISSDFPTAFINQHLAILRFSEESNPFYISAFIASKGGQTLFNKLDKGGVKSGLNFTDLKSYKLLLPPLELQNQFAERVAVIEAQKQKAQLELAKSEELFNSLLQRAFNGELS